MPSPNIQSDYELIELLKQESLPAFNEIYHRYSGPMYKFAFSILKDEAECDDILQNVFTWLWDHRKNLKITSLKAYLFAAVKFNLAGVIRVSQRRSEILANAPALNEAIEEDSLELKELIEIIRSFTSSLPDRAREIFELSRKEYLTNKEIALRLGISEKTVENQMNISLKKLKVHLGRMSFWLMLI
ncbi:RNA polymerase sigma-70 factor [Pedobacter sp. MR2016-24]|uniref:RNA polymerase sigma-70 factor n=1 Tax=Pedobacter sp. MR2016-24 TaxID=2994466 RepID=UPI0022457C59|nr:RNA polymerase sigma-70 factor [Pedobacter sp. MR2016-24]MCX2483331.1 RNA polymerase sigma-70 factor [Pedobacter sp. MR2016-24]